MDSQTSAPTHLPVLVSYSLRKINARQWLVRDQSSLDPLATDLNSSELLCGDVKTFSMTGSYATHQESIVTSANMDQDPTPLVFQRIAGAQRLPDRVRLRIDLENESSPMLNTVLYIH